MSNVEFLIHEVQRDGEITRVSGIVNKGNVSLNTEFLSVRTERGEETPLWMRPLGIVAYRRQIVELPTGTSGELHLSGTAGVHLGKHCMLAG